ncbi:MAG TPA: TRZ/ATZ family hydrolase [Dermatophilaceae bacterium]|nr:TRZ/ATZ family hydrolase [Dermatophilaceae bacterium]
MEIIEAGWVLPIDPWEVIPDGAVAIANGRVVSVGTAAQVRQSHPRATRTRLPDHVLLPGLVNGHTHAAMTLLRGVADDVPLMTWLHEHIWPIEGRWVDPQFVADGTLLASAEMLSGGVTCFADMYFFPQAAIEATQKAGIRIMSGQVIVDGATPYALDAEDHITKGMQIMRANEGRDLVHFSLAPHAPYTVSDATLSLVVELCEQSDLPLNIHVHETLAEIEEGTVRYGQRPLARLERLGVVNPRLIAAHAVHLTDDEIALLAERDAALVHCPTSNLKLASGIARLRDWLHAGLRVGLGTDGTASNNRLDLLSEMRLASLLAKGSTGDATALPARESLYAATLGGAQALGLSDEIGSLTPGKAADMIAVDMSDFELAPVYDVVSHLVNCVERRHVRQVWVAGTPRVQDGELVDLYLGELTRMARRWQERIKPAR